MVPAVGCCGDKRTAFRAAQPRPGFVPSPPARPAVQAPAPGEAARLEHVGRTSVRVRGPVSGRVYTFTPAHRVQQVDAADAPLLLRSRLFRPAR